MYYLKTDTIIKAYKELTSIQIKDPNIFHTYIILKAVGINKLSYVPAETISKNNGFYFASRISVLFSPDEPNPKKYDFINPFSMSEWSSQAVTEPLGKWVKGRIKNNIMGGATTWRSIITQDNKNDNIKFTYDYINEIKKLTLGSNKISLIALAIWSNRFTAFDKRVTLKEICDEFISSYKLDPDEVAAFFNTKDDDYIEFTSILHDTLAIRNLIGKPKDETVWSPSSLSADNASFISLNSYMFNVLPARTQDVTVESLKDILDQYYQLILSP